MQASRRVTDKDAQSPDPQTEGAPEQSVVGPPGISLEPQESPSNTSRAQNLPQPGTSGESDLPQLPLTTIAFRSGYSTKLSANLRELHPNLFQEMQEKVQTEMQGSQTQTQTQTQMQAQAQMQTQV